MILVLFTASYPYVVGGEQNFLETEIRHLSSFFERIVLVPEQNHGTRAALPSGVEVDDSYAALLQKRGMQKTLFRSLSSGLFYGGMLEKPSLLFSLAGLKRLFTFVGKAEITRRWVENFILRSGVNIKECLIYTYWFDQAAAGAVWAKKKFPNLKAVSRAHGYDIYEEWYYRPAFWPCRKTVLSVIDRLYLDSESGRSYVCGKYPEFASKYETALLGVRDPGFVTHSSKDNVFRVVSCSMIRPEKRVSLMLGGIRHAAALRPAQKMEWHHFGTGVSLDEIQQTANETFPPNARAYFHGYSTPAALFEFYRTNPLDVFLNLSVTEGTPVSIMEAICCGIPVIATAVGGNVEIVSERNGILLNSNPAPEDVAAALFFMIDHPAQAEEKRRGSREVWKMKYDAGQNFRAFAENLAFIRSA